MNHWATEMAMSLASLAGFLVLYSLYLQLGNGAPLWREKSLMVKGACVSVPVRLQALVVFSPDFVFLH